MTFKNQRGEGLISVMVSIAILGILIVTMVSLYQLFGTMMAKSLLRREADVLANRIRGLVLQKTMCETAFAVPTQTWDGQNEKDVTITESPTTTYRNGYTFANGRLVIQRLFLRKKYIPNSFSPKTADNNPAPVYIGNIKYNSYAGELVIQTGLASDATNLGLLTERVAQVLLVIHPTTQAITSCDVNDESSMGFVCDEDTANNSGNPCPTVPNHPGCANYTFVNGIDNRGEPICNCKRMCPKPIWRGQDPIGCSNTTTILAPDQECPAEAKTAGPTLCYGWEGVVCKWKKHNPGTDGCPSNRWAVWKANCKIVFP